MAKTKLKSVFTREDVYTVLQLLKAIAVSVDDNEAITDEDIKKLQDKVLTSVAVVSVDHDHKKIVLTFADNTTIESVPFESGGATLPQGYEVDSTGKVIINKALNVVSQGDVEVRNNLIVDNKVKLNNLFDLVNTASVPFFNENTLIHEIKSKADANLYKGKYGFYVTKGSSKTVISIGVIDYAYDSNYTIKGLATTWAGYDDTFNLFSSWEDNSGDKYIKVKYDGTLDMTSIEEAVPTLSYLQKNHLKTLYQHTVHITFGTTGTSVTDVCFTALSTKNTKITNYDTLHSVFGGRKIAVSGIGKCWSYPGGATMTPLYLDLHGGTISTDKLFGTDSANVLNDPLSTFVTNEGAIKITDDVTPL